MRQARLFVQLFTGLLVCLLVGCAEPGPSEQPTPRDPSVTDAIPGLTIPTDPSTADWQRIKSGASVAWELGTPDTFSGAPETRARGMGYGVAVLPGAYDANDTEDILALVDAGATYVTFWQVDQYAYASEDAPDGEGGEGSPVGGEDPYEAFLVWYNDTYAAVKQAAPGTIVFPTFSYEGLRQHNDWTRILDFPGRDLLGVLSHPSTRWNDPSGIPAGYYDRLERDEPVIVFTGWPAAGGSTPEEQVEGLERILAILPDPQMIVWHPSHDEPQGALEAMGLWHTDGTARPAAMAWQQAFGQP